MAAVRYRQAWGRWLMAAGLCLGAVGTLHAQTGLTGLVAWEAGPLAALSPEEREQMREQIRQQWQSKTPEERQRLREEFREKREAMTPEQRQQFREQARERWQQYSPEQRQELLRDHRERESLDRSRPPHRPPPLGGRVHNF